MSKRSERLPEAASVAGGGVAARPEVAAFLARATAAAAPQGDGGRPDAVGRTRPMSRRSERLPEAASVAGGGVAARPEVAAFLARVKAAAPPQGDGRLVFALDATMSRQPTWDLACSLQAEM